MYTHLRKHNDPNKKITYFCPIEGCNKKYNNKTGLRTHIAKHYQDCQVQVGQPGMGMVSLINPEILPEGFDDIDLEESNEMATASESSNQSAGSGILSQDNTIINPSDLLNTDGPTVSGSIGGLNMTLSNSLITQLIVASENQQPVNLSELTSPAISESSQPVIESSIISPTSSSSAAVVLDSDLTKDLMLSPPQSLEPKVVIANDMSIQISYAEGGSARTDFHGNHILSSKARQRQKMLKEKIKIDMSPLQDSNDSLVTGSLASENPNEVLAGFNASEILSGRGITFRDPETGAIYVQTQLLQDDPPNGDLYDDPSMDTGDPNLSMTMLQDVGDVSEFTGTTINLQDLE